MDIEQIRKNAPDGATHYYKDDLITCYFFYSSDVNLWFVWNSYFGYWSSNIFQERIELIKPL